MKNSLKDIIPPEKRSIRNVPLPRRQESVAVERKSESISHHSNIRVHEKVERKDIENPLEFGGKRRSLSSDSVGRGRGVWFIAIFAVIAVLLSVTWVMSKTIVNLDVKKIVIEANGEFSVSNTGGSNDLLYDTVEFSLDSSKVVDATGQKEVISKSGGVVIIYNNFSSTPQALVAGTRLESPEGLIFRLNSPVTIPGKKTVSGKAVPGSVEVKVTADSTGEKYNLNLTDFTIPGFKSTPKFNLFYARSKAPFTGGAIGTVAVVSPAVLAETQKVLQEELTASALKKITTELPKDFVFIDGSYEKSFKSFEPTVGSEKGKANVKEQILIRGYIFKQDNLIKALADIKKVEIIKDAQVALDNSNIKVVSVKPEGEGKINVEFAGKLRGEYVVNEEVLKKALKNQKKSDVPKILTTFPTIEKAQVIVKPFWINSISKSENKISILKNSL